MANWGYDTIGAGTQSATGWIWFGGESPGGTLDSVSIYLAQSDSPHATRVAVYSGGNVAGGTPANAALVEDLGVYTSGGSPGWVTVNSATNPTLPAGDLWLVFKNDTSEEPQTYFSAGQLGSSSWTVIGFLTLGASFDGVSAAASTAFAASISASPEALSGSTSPRSFYLTYSALTGPTITNVPNMTRGIQATITGTGFGT